MTCRYRIVVFIELVIRLLNVLVRLHIHIGLLNKIITHPLLLFGLAEVLEIRLIYRRCVRHVVVVLGLHEGPICIQGLLVLSRYHFELGIVVGTLKILNDVKVAFLLQICRLYRLFPLTLSPTLFRQLNLLGSFDITNLFLIIDRNLLHQHILLLLILLLPPRIRHQMSQNIVILLISFQNSRPFLIILLDFVTFF